MKKISVVILNWNGRDILSHFLPSVLRETPQDGSTEVCVADNGSTDDSVEWLQRTYPEVRVIAFEQNYGFPKGYNEALKRTEAEYFVLLNSDVEVAPDWLQPMRDYMDTHPMTAACQPKIKSYREPAFFEYAGACGGYLDLYGYPFCRGRLMDTIEEDKGQYDSVAPVLWATGAALFIRSKDYREAGGLDDRFFAHMEEIDLCWRLRSRGREVVCIPQSTVYHLGGATLQKNNPRKTFLNFRNNLLMLYKNLSDDELKRVMRVRFLLDYTAALKFLISFKVKDARMVIDARKAFKKMRPLFEKDRQENLQKTVRKDSLGILHGSILWLYYVKRKKYFSEIVLK